MSHSYSPIIGIDGYKIISSKEPHNIELTVEYVGLKSCPHCSSESLRTKDSFWRRVKHYSIGNQRSELLIKAYKYYCRSCHKYFNSRFPGIKPRFQSTEPFREEVAQKHHWGFSRSQSAKTLGISASTVERCYKSYLTQKRSHSKAGSCPKVLGIDEKHFTRKKGYMTTLCDLKRHKVFDVTLGRSELSLASFLKKLPDKKNCKVIVMDLSETYRSIARKHFTNAMIVADRFHVVKLVNHHFLKTWADLDEVGRKNRGLLSLMRRHEYNLSEEQRIRLRGYLKKNSGLEAIYDFKQKMMRLVLARVTHKSQARVLIPEFIDGVEMLRQSGLRWMKTLGETLWSWQEEIVRMWRFSKTNSITEGLHNRMEEIIRRAYGFRNFENFRLRVLNYCS
jgi:transposase